MGFFLGGGYVIFKSAADVCDNMKFSAHAIKVV